VPNAWKSKKSTKKTVIRPNSRSLLKSICSNCSKQGDQGYQCRICNSLVHPFCSKEQTDLGPGRHYTCRSCSRILSRVQLQLEQQQRQHKRKAVEVTNLEVDFGSSPASNTRQRRKVAESQSQVDSAERSNTSVDANEENTDEEQDVDNVPQEEQQEDADDVTQDEAFDHAPIPNAIARNRLPRGKSVVVFMLSTLATL
jgi:hypothetical protein